MGTGERLDNINGYRQIDYAIGARSWVYRDASCKFGESRVTKADLAIKLLICS